MDYIESINRLKEIESKFDVMSVKYKGITVWPYVRVYLIDSLSAHRAQKASISNIMFIIRHLFDGNVLSLFKRHRIWVYDGMASLRHVGGRFVHQTSGPIFEIENSALLFANPGRADISVSKDELVERDFLSNSWSIMLSRALTILAPKRWMQIENEDVLQRVNEYLNVSFNYRYYIKHLFSQKTVVDMILWLWKKPRIVFMICPYAQMGYLLSYHNHGIPVIELQHGVLNSSHYAYNSMYGSPLLHPDEICVYGEVEYKYFTEEQTKYTPKVSITGLYILEMIDKYSNTDIFTQDRLQYDSIVVVAGQPTMEHVMAPFVDEVASKVPSVLFVYKPRVANTHLEFKSPNVRLVGNVNIYEYLKWCDVHSTISSTTCLEAHYFKKPTVFYDHGSVGSDYYSHILGEENGAYYVNDVNSYIIALGKALRGEFIYKTLFAKNCVESFKRVVERYL